MFVVVFIFFFLFFFFNDTATTEIYTLSLHDALPILEVALFGGDYQDGVLTAYCLLDERAHLEDRKSTRLNSSHRCISYAVFCLKKKKKKSSSEHLATNSKTPTNIK